MGQSYLHITNGDDLTEKIQEMHFSGDLVTWREMLCEGPCVQDVGDPEFLKLRKKFLKDSYGISAQEYQKKFITELDRLKKIGPYDEIVLWFEFDLFSHMNMLAMMAFLLQHGKKSPFSLVCSRKLEGEKELTPLSELSKKHLQNHYTHRIFLSEDDVSTAELIWELYCSQNPKRLTSEIKKSTNFEYLASSIRAHIERFPNAHTGLNSLEVNVLKLIKKHEITSLQQLLGYALKYQGYYGYVDIQMERIIHKLQDFFSESESGIHLNEHGEKALGGKTNYYQKLKDNEYYGGVRKYAFLYDPDSHDLLKL